MVEKTDEYILKQYTCGYCRGEFRHYVRQIGGIEDAMGRVSKKYSTQVKCPYCRNGLKTWEEGEEIGRTKQRPVKRVYKLGESINGHNKEGEEDEN